jgi:hypothetical protein
MAAPATTARGVPAGIMLEDGFRTTLAFSLLPTFSLWEQTVKPPALDGRDPVDVTTMHSLTWTAKAPRKLIDMGPISMKGGYDPNIYAQALTLLNRKGAATVRFPDNTTLDVWAFLQKLEPDDNAEGNMPTMTATVIVTNRDAASGAEAAPVLTNVTGT